VPASGVVVHAPVVLSFEAPNYTNWSIYMNAFLSSMYATNTVGAFPTHI
jgi:hypothetical protein